MLEKRFHAVEEAEELLHQYVKDIIDKLEEVLAPPAKRAQSLLSASAVTATHWTWPAPLGRSRCHAVVVCARSLRSRAGHSRRRHARLCQRTASQHRNSLLRRYRLRVGLVSRRRRRRRRCRHVHLRATSLAPQGPASAHYKPVQAPFKAAPRDTRSPQVPQAKPPPALVSQARRVASR